MGALALALLLVSGCARGPGGGATLGNRRVTPPPEPTRPALQQQTGTPAGAAPHLRGAVMPADEVYAAYHALLTQYVDPVDDSVLLNAAEAVLRADLDSSPRLPLETLPLSLTAAPTGHPRQDWQVFGDAFNALIQTQPEWAASGHADWSVVRAMVGALKDDHTAFLTPEEVQRRTETAFAGIGVLLTRGKGGSAPLLAEVYPDTPAAAAGLRRGDRILQVNGHDAPTADLSVVAQMIRGQRDETVSLRIQRYGVAQPLDVRIKRAVVKIDPAVGRMLGATAGYLRIRNFSPGASDAVLGILAQGRERGARGWIVDLRGNPGGSLQEVLTAAGGFLTADNTTLGFEVNRQRDRKPLVVQNAAAQAVGPLVVLIDGDAASGAEILAAALQDHRLATIVGSKSSGNVGVSTLQPLPDGSAVQITQERFQSPSGRDLDGQGVTPDVSVAMSDQDIEAGQDPQLARAGEVLAKLLSQSGG